MSLEELNKIIEKRDVWVAISTSLSIFFLSNIGLILSGTRRFQDSTSIFVLQTTVNLSAILLHQQTVDNFWLQAGLMTMISTTIFYLF